MSSETEYNVYYLNFPADSRLPRRSRTKTISLHPAVPLRRRKFEPDFIRLDSSERRGWSNWVTGRQHLLFYWNLAAEACQDVAYMAQHGKWGAVALWLRRATHLLLGSTGVTTYLHNFDRCIYEWLVKDRGIALEDFDEESSHEYRFLKESLEVMRLSLNRIGNKVTDLPFELNVALRSFDDALRAFEVSVAAQIIESSGWSNADDGSASQEEKYDFAIGVCRTPMVFIEDYYLSLLNNVSDMRQCLELVSLSPETRTGVENGDELMLAIIRELLDPPCYRPDI